VSAPSPAPPSIEAIPREDPRFPAALAHVRGAPRVVYVAGGADRLHALLREPTVAILGTRRASDYGMEMAHGLARGLAASGVTVLSGLAEGIACAAHAGAVAVGGPTVTVMPAGLDVCYPATRRTLYRRVREVGCAISEHPPGVRTSRWCHLARARLVVALARLVIIVEAQDDPSELQAAHLAQASARRLAAVPGRVGAPAARGPHVLLREGAGLVRDAQDALDLLYDVGAPPAPPPPAARARAQARSDPSQAPPARPQTLPDPRALPDRLQARPDHRQARPDHQQTLPDHLQALLDRIGAGQDTLAKLTRAGAERDAVVLALAQLELHGALGRGDGGRYVPRLGAAGAPERHPGASPHTPPARLRGG
jgi:DNA processing protein